MMKGNSLSILLLSCILFSCSTKQSKEQAIDDIAAKVGTIVNQKWSTYKYKSHSKKLLTMIIVLICIQD